MNAEFTTSSTKGIIILNTAALKLMEIGNKDRILVFDVMSAATSMQDRFYLTKGFNFRGKAYGMKISSHGQFMDATFYNLLMNNDMAAEHCTNDDLVKKGLYFYRNTAKRKNVLTPTKKVTGDIIRYTEKLTDGSVIELFPIAEGMPPQPIYQLTNLIWNNNPLLEQ